MALLVASMLTPIARTAHAAECTTGKPVQVVVEGVVKQGFAFAGRTADEIARLAVLAQGRASNLAPGMRVFFRNLPQFGPTILTSPGHLGTLSKVLGSLGLGVAGFVFSATDANAGEWEIDVRSPTLTQPGFQNYIQQFEGGELPGTKNMKYCPVPKKEKKEEAKPKKEERRGDEPASTTTPDTTPATPADPVPVEGTGPGICPTSQPDCVLSQDPLIDPFGGGGGSGGSSPSGSYCMAVCGPGGGHPVPSQSYGWACYCYGQEYTPTQP